MAMSSLLRESTRTTQSVLAAPRFLVGKAGVLPKHSGTGLESNSAALRLHSAPRSDRTIRSATLIGYAEAAASVGLDPVTMLARAGLDATCMDNRDARIALDAYLALLAVSAAKAKCGDFGVRAAMARGLPDYGIVSLLMREAETFEVALDFYTRYLALHCDDVLIVLDRRYEDPFITMDLPGNNMEEVAQATQFCMVGVTRQLRWLTGGDFQPKLVCFAFPRPHSVFPPSRFVDCEVVYNQTVSGIVVSRDILARPLVTSEPFLRRIAMQHLEPMLTEPPNRFIARVQRVVKQLLPLSNCSSEVVAAHFRIDRRTLNRRLEREGATFFSVVQQIRVEAALRALDGSRCSLSEIADFLGFKSLSSFSRWFRNSFGCKASDWQRGAQSRSNIRNSRHVEAAGDLLVT